MHPLAQIEFRDGSLTNDELSNRGGFTGGPQAQRDALSVGPPPCDGCPLRDRCSDKLLACTAFYQYAESNRFEPALRVGPTRAMYRSVMASS
jgi:hypothetical protein